MILLSRNGNGYTSNKAGFDLTQLLRYINYRLKAKGRHGTHSPFVYAFVEEVLHDKRHFYALGFIMKESKAQQLDIALSLFLFKTIHFLKAEHITLIGKAEKYTGIVKAANTRASIRRYTHTDAAGVIIMDMQDATADMVQQLLDRKDSFSIILLNPHRQEDLWQKAIADERVLLSMDCWQAGLLLRNQSFKTKQHFFLK